MIILDTSLIVDSKTQVLCSYWYMSLIVYIIYDLTDGKGDAKDEEDMEGLLITGKIRLLSKR